ncbi:Reverse transcriptase (RNA-dependent DNA polymerase) [Leuconostoc suionicum]|uniref:Reverse transcriptase (RNA-dependent DNA polymerase) n=1 Tax=Leuconostoc suionicum TaxID=1511761 RepID=A0A2N9K807_9LACO|nr:reverse transcriptase domain-containing protein [Leuconostoc suionicum]SPD91487.1 Reverse transcriptase (RNA-dependent DNA polymerase) [Leuconostoc suionicum]SPE06712.1 Reverse transcriptase (RNA-dependent DNA polymerase) [Leuconostoc suionicum]SPH03219.1 Reverse transcriptase (RNA-dependent DNA polymerase) [Leuconostoc suionicum]
MNPSNYRLIKLNSKRTFYLFNQKELKLEYLSLSKWLSKRYPPSTSRNLAISKVIRSLSYGEYSFTDKGHYRLDSTKKTIIRGDIKDFFPSINKHFLYSKLIRSFNVSIPETKRKLLADLLLDPAFIGLPQGISVSSILSEIYLEDFDNLMKIYFPHCTYIRYVDDFLLICPYEEAYNYHFKEIIIKILHSMNLQLSSDKFKKITFVNKTHFQFLGYQFTNSDKNLILSISKSKVKKIQNRLTGYFQEYRHSGLNKKQKFQILYYKIFNTFYGVTTIGPDSYKIQKIGIPFSYPKITTSGNFQKFFSNIHYQIERTPQLSSKEIDKINKIYHNYSYSFQGKRHLHTSDILLNNKYNYMKLSIKKIIQITKLIDPSFKYTKQSSIGLLHNFFYTLYKK